MNEGKAMHKTTKRDSETSCLKAPVCILNFHFEVEQRSFDTVNVSFDKIDKLNVKKNNGLGANFWFFLFHRSCLVSPYLYY